jgi:hypothetical protein
MSSSSEPTPAQQSARPIFPAPTAPTCGEVPVAEQQVWRQPHALHAQHSLTHLQKACRQPPARPAAAPRGPPTWHGHGEQHLCHGLSSIKGALCLVWGPLLLQLGVSCWSPRRLHACCICCVVALEAGRGLECDAATRARPAGCCCCGTSSRCCSSCVHCFHVKAVGCQLSLRGAEWVAAWGEC